MSKHVNTVSSSPESSSSSRKGKLRPPSNMWACHSSPSFMRLSSCRVMMLANVLVLLGTPVLIVVQGYNPYAYNPLGITAPTSPGSRRQQHLRTRLSASPHGSDRRVLQGNLLEQLQRHTTIWADTANVASIERLSRVGIVDVTTNPSIVSATALGDEGAASTLLAQVTIGECMVGWL